MDNKAIFPQIGDHINNEIHTTSRINFDKYEVRSTGSKNFFLNVIYGVLSEHTICCWASLRHTNRFGA